MDLVRNVVSRAKVYTPYKRNEKAFNFKKSVCCVKCLNNNRTQPWKILKGHSGRLKVMSFVGVLILYLNP